MGDYHGLRRVIARTGDQFMLLSSTPDGQAVVAGLMSDLSAADLSQIAGGNLTELGMLHGLRGLLVKSGVQFQVFYATPDGQRVIPGVHLLGCRSTVLLCEAVCDAKLLMSLK